RPLFESLVRGENVYRVLSDEKIEQLYQTDNYDKVLQRKLSKELDDSESIEFYSKIYDKIFKKMHDFTHTGVIQIAKSFNETIQTIKPNFDDGLVVDTVQSMHILMTLSTLTYFEIGEKNSEIIKDEIEHFMDKYPIKETE
ncbi:MAG: hypothetical protein JXQ76_13315, partial [Campylobacterales bacterium]|nr:hypothetical protein [Campylobacterales bacterium]